MTKIIRNIVLGAMLAGSALSQPAERQILKQEKPSYPALLQKMGIGGTVKLTALVAADGSVTKTKIEGGNPMLGEIACVAVKRWKYARAAQATTEPVEMTFEANLASVRLSQ
jgi:TonB family protein